MIKRIYKKKLIVCGIAIFAILLIYVFPESKQTLSIKEEVEYVNKDIQTSTIYLLNSNNLLSKAKIITSGKDEVSKAKELLEALTIEGKKEDSLPSGFKAIIPSNTEIRSITFNNSLIKVDFTDELMNTTKENEEKIIEAIVYTLTNIENVRYVIIYMNGNILNKLPQSKINLPSTLDRSFGINKEYNITNTNDINKTTVYYISEFNNNEYYIPVTKVNNDSRSKIEIIVDELSSSNVYNANLMSYLNNNTKVLSVNELNGEMIINFNSAIFNDINTKDILEEVIYTISLSINDNYNVNTVVFSVEGKEICKSVLKTLE